MAVKTIKFMIEFEKPSRIHVLGFNCPLCHARAGDPCTASRWDAKKQKSVPHPIRDPHHDRYAESMNLEVVRATSSYRIKP